jgi:hypothetical protein
MLGKFESKTIRIMSLDESVRVATKGHLGIYIYIIGYTVKVGVSRLESFGSNLDMCVEWYPWNLASSCGHDEALASSEPL